MQLLYIVSHYLAICFIGLLKQMKSNLKDIILRKNKIFKYLTGPM